MSMWEVSGAEGGLVMEVGGELVVRPTIRTSLHDVLKIYF